MMKARPDCIPCIVRQSLKVARNVTHDEWLQRKVLNESLTMLTEIDFDRPPAEITFDVIRQATKTLGSQECFEKDKKLYTKEALALEDRYRKAIESSDDSLLAAAKLSVAAGVIDINTPEPVDLNGTLETALEKDFAVDDFDDFREDLDNANSVLFLLGNAGEAVFDRLLIGELKGKAVICVAGKSPVLLQATAADAREAKIDIVAKIINNGVDTLGSPPEIVSTEFKEKLENADLIIAKGQNNFETLSGIKLPPTYFALSAACSCVSRNLGVNVGEIAFVKNIGE